MFSKFRVNLKKCHIHRQICQNSLKQFRDYTRRMEKFGTNRTTRKKCGTNRTTQKSVAPIGPPEKSVASIGPLENSVAVEKSVTNILMNIIVIYKTTCYKRHLSYIPLLNR